MKRNLTAWLVASVFLMSFAVPTAFSADETNPQEMPAVPAIKMVSGSITEISGSSLKLDQRGTPIDLTIGAEASIRKGAETIDVSKLAVGDQVLALVSGDNQVKSLFVKTAPSAMEAGN